MNNPSIEAGRDAPAFPPARLRFEGHGYVLDPDDRQAWRGVEAVRSESEKDAG